MEVIFISFYLQGKDYLGTYVLPEASAIDYAVF
jgi:hypothetical protein